MADRNTLISQVMTPFPISVDYRERAEVALSIMREHKIRHLPVTRNSGPFSILSERELLNALSHVDSESARKNLVVEDVCAMEPYIVETSALLLDVLSVMHKAHIGSAVVVQNGRVAGIFTAVDCCKLLLNKLSEGT